MNFSKENLWKFQKKWSICAIFLRYLQKQSRNCGNVKCTVITPFFAGGTPHYENRNHSDHWPVSDKDNFLFKHWNEPELGNIWLCGDQQQGLLLDTKHVSFYSRWPHVWLLKIIWSENVIASSIHKYGMMNIFSSKIYIL